MDLDDLDIKKHNIKKEMLIEKQQQIKWHSM
jgi:hypothetical protein